jgi:hypothetical protein
MCFTAIGADHVIANMFYIPLGIWLDDSKKLTVGTYIGKSMAAAGLGNIFGGGFFVGTLYWYIYLTGEELSHLESGHVENGNGDGDVVSSSAVDSKMGRAALRERVSPA